MPYLPEALASLEEQTFRDFEVCLWDNGSTDGSVEEAKQWIPARLPGRVVTGHPLPLHECLARMVEEARTEFVARMDGDDVCLPNRFQLQIEHLQNNPQTAVVSGQKETTDETGKSLGLSEKFPTQYSDILFGFLFQNPILHPGVMMRRSSVLSIGNYSAPKPVEDYDLWLRMSLKYPIANLEETILRYRRHVGAVCGLNNKAPSSLEKSVIETVKKYSQQLFRIQGDVYESLHKKTHPCSFIPLLRAMKSISLRTDTPVASICTSSQNLMVARCLTGSHDLISRATWLFLEHLPSQKT
jgi:glycosyltransferase involved in cell wall biosynthesis